MKKLLSFMLALFFVSANVSATNFYVVPGGTGGGSGWDQASALGSVATAVNWATAANNDTVFVAAGTYTETITLKDGVTVLGGYNATTGERDIKANVTIIDGGHVEGSTDTKVVLNGTASISTPFTTATLIEGFTIQNGFHQWEGAGAAIGANTTISKCIFRNCTASRGSGVYAPAGGTIKDCVIEFCTGTGSQGAAIYLEGNAVIENTIVRGNKVRCAAVYGNGASTVIRNCVIYNNSNTLEGGDYPSSAGVYTKGLLVNSVIANNYGGDYAGMRIEGIIYNTITWKNQASTVSTYINYLASACTKYSNNASDDSSKGADAVKFTSEVGPGFVNPTTFVGAPTTAEDTAAVRAADFSLLATSPCIDKGIANEYTVAYDLLGVERPQGEAYDLGAYEYKAEVVATPVISIAGDEAITLEEEATQQLTASFDIESELTIVWSSSDEAIATVEAGLVTAVAAGEAYIYAKAEGATADSVKLTVTAKPVVPQLNVYAYGLSSTFADGNLTVNYSLNANAKEVSLLILNGDETVATHALEGVAKGANTATIDLSALEAGGYTWAIKAAGEERTELSEDLLAGDTNYDFYQPRGVAADINPESPFFGQIYMGNSKSALPGADSGVEGAVATPTGVAIFDATLVQQGSIYGGGVTWEADGWGPGRIKIGEDGMVYVNDHAKKTAGVFKMDPANPTADFTPVLDLAQRGVTFALPVAMEIIGSGAERTLYTWNYIGVNDGQILKYAIGENDNYALAPDTFAVASFTGNQYAEIAADGRGGFWLSQSRAQIDGYHALAHITSEGVIDYTSGEHTDIFTSTSGQYSTRGIVSLNKEKNLLAMAWDKTATVFSIAYDETTGAPTLTKVYATNTIGKNVDGICFDYANNLYVGSASSERLHVYATPSANVQVTPAPAAQAFVVAPANQFNVYAYDLSSTFEEGNLTVKYSLNAWANAVTLLILDGEDVVATHDLGIAKEAGSYEATVSLADLAEGNYTWAIKATGEERADISGELLGMPNATYWQPRDMAFDKNPESEFFGQIYVTNSANGGGDAYTGNKTAIYVLNPLYELQGNYDGGIAWNTNNGPHRLYIDEAGLVYASNRSDTDGGIFIMDPANPTANFKSLFDPAKRGETYTKITGFDFAGEGADRVLVTADAVTYDSNLGSVGNILKYAIGDTKENFAGVPDTIGTAAALNLGNQHNQIAHDGRGGWWIAQNRGAEGGLQCLTHITAEGVQDYRSNNDGLGIGGSPDGALALNDDCTLLAMAADQGIKVFAITWGEDGKPALTLKYSTGVLADNMTGVDFDYAGNLLAGSLQSERLYAFALPSENVATTPAASKYAIEIAPAGPTEITLDQEDYATIVRDDLAPFIVNATFDVEGDYEVTWEVTDMMGNDVTEGAAGLTIAIDGNTIIIRVSNDYAGGSMLRVIATYGDLFVGAYYMISEAAPAGPEGLSITPYEGSIASGATLQLSLGWWPETYQGEATWKSSDETLATVSADGLVTSLYTATDKDTVVTITATSVENETVFASATFTLLKAVETGLENVAAEGKAIKIIENGNVYIIKEGVRYTILGTIVE